MAQPKRFTKEDKNRIVEHICDEFATRKGNRRGREKIWKEIDRQLAMEPDLSHKKVPNQDVIDESKAWLPETELPWQAQTLEITTADARRMKFPDAGPWYSPHAALTDEYLERVDFAAIVTGDENGVPSLINQDNANKLVHGIMEHWHRQYDFYKAMDLIDAEAIKYGLGIGRAREVQKSIFLHESKGVHKSEDVVPALVPRSVWHTYLDDNQFALLNEGYALTGAVIYEEWKLLKDVEIAASKGSTDPMNPNGGWMPGNVRNLQGDEKGQVRLLEYEGDMVVPRVTTESLYLPNAIITVALGDKDTREIIRIRYNTLSGSSYIGFPYHLEHINDPYGTSPLMKGYPLQVTAVDTLNRMLEAGALKVDPPIGYDKDDTDFAQSGGPVVYPGAAWGTLGDIKIHDNFGEPADFFGIFEGLRREYSNVTGTDAPRLGAQTISHTTAYAKEAELARGTIRTVDFVRNTLKGPLARWLDLEYQMGKRLMKKTDIYIPQYNGFVTITSKHLPDKVVFDVHGSGGPAEEQAKRQERLAALQFAINIDNMRMQQQMAVGQPPKPKLDLDKVIEQTLQEGGWTDIDAITSNEVTTQGTPGPQGMAGSPGADQGVVSTALQALNFGGQGQ